MHEVLISLLARHRELIYEVCISLRRAESPKRDQNLVNGVTQGEAGADTKCDSLSKKSNKILGIRLGGFYEKRCFLPEKRQEKRDCSA